MVKSILMNCESSGFSLQDIMLLVGMKDRTGELLLESGNNIGSIIFHQGRVLQAFSPYSRAIGDLLVEDGVISEAELLEILQQQKKNYVSPIGFLFLKAGKITAQKLELLIHEQIRHAVKDFMAWQKLNVSFVDKEIKPFDSIHLSVHEFVSDDTLRSASRFLSRTCHLAGTAASAPAV
jgi:hypothetical protein